MYFLEGETQEIRRKYVNMSSSILFASLRLPFFKCEINMKEAGKLEELHLPLQNYIALYFFFFLRLREGESYHGEKLRAGGDLHSCLPLQRSGLEAAKLLIFIEGSATRKLIYVIRYSSSGWWEVSMSIVVDSVFLLNISFEHLFDYLFWEALLQLMEGKAVHGKLYMVHDCTLLFFYHATVVTSSSVDCYLLQKAFRPLLQATPVHLSFYSILFYSDIVQTLLSLSFLLIFSLNTCTIVSYSIFSVNFFLHLHLFQIYGWAC